MAAPFASVESRVADAIAARLANATATISDPVDLVDRNVDGIFDASYVEPFSAVGAPSPSFLCADSGLANVAYGTLVAINGVTYKVVKVMTQNAQMSRLKLERQP